MKSHRNLLAGLANSLWSAAVGIAVVPLYLKYLGMEAYGLIAFFTSAQALIQLLDMGLVPTMNREVARGSAINNLSDARALLHSLSLVYWVTAAALGVTMAVLAPFISSHWLRATSMSHKSVTDALLLMAVVFACRWPVAIYNGAIIGAQRQTVTSVINIVVVSLGSVGAVVLLAFLAPRIEVYFAWQAIVGIAYALAMRLAAWHVIGRPSTSRIDWTALRRIWRFSAGMSGVAISGTILMQLDKVILSRLLSLEAFGSYALAATLSGGLYVLLSPTFNVVYPRLSRMVASGDMSTLTTYYRLGTRLLLACLFPLASFISVYAYEVVAMWTHDPAVAAHAAPIVSIFIFGTALNGAMHFPYALQLAYGVTRLPLTINAILLVVTVPTTVVLAYKFGAIGGAWSWAVINALYLAIGTWLTHRTLLKGIGVKWLWNDVGIPLILSIVVVGGVGMVVHEYTTHAVLLIAAGAFSCIAATALVAVTSADSRAAIFQMARGKPLTLGNV